MSHTATLPALDSPVRSESELRGEPLDVAESSIPVWFELLVVVIIAGVLSFGSVGLLLAFYGHFSSAIVFPISLALMVVLIVLARPRLRGTDRTPPQVRWPAIGMCLVALASAGINGKLDGHYVQVDRDPGVYATTAKWLASHGTLEVNNAGLPWVTKGAGFNWSSPGMYPENNGRLEFQFAHFVPVLMAEGQKLGGDRLMFAVPAVIGALALCVVYAVGCRLVRRPWLVLAVVTALAGSLPELMVSRDSYSETATQLLLLGSIWAILRVYQRPTWSSGLFAGLVLGAAITSRIDALVYLIPVPIVFAVAYLAAEAGHARRQIAVCVGLVILGCIPGTVLGDLDVTDRAGLYYNTLRASVNQLRAAVLLAGIAAIAIVLLWPRLRRRAILSTVLVRAQVVLPIAVVAIMLLLWGVRPAIYHPNWPSNVVTAALQRQEGLKVDPLRSYAEQSINWLSWYYGPFTIALAILGLAAIVGSCLRRRSPAALLLLAMTGLGLALYIWYPNITPEQLWATRRFIPAGLPLLALASAVGIEAVAGVIGSGVERGWLRRSFLALAALTVIAFSLSATWPLRNFQTQAGFVGVIDQTCNEIGADAAVVFIAGDPYGPTLVQTMRSFCNVPSTYATTAVTPTELAAVSAKWRAEHKTLWVLGSTEAVVRAMVAEPTPAKLIGSATSRREFEKTLSRPPTQYATQTLTLWGAAVPVPA